MKKNIITMLIFFSLSIVICHHIPAAFAADGTDESNGSVQEGDRKTSTGRQTKQVIKDAAHSALEETIRSIGNSLSRALGGGATTNSAGDKSDLQDGDKQSPSPGNSTSRRSRPERF